MRNLHPFRRASAALVATAALTLTGLAAVPSAGTGPVALEPSAAKPTLIEESLNGQGAIDALGDGLAAAAKLNEMTRSELKATLLGDETNWIDRQGALYVIDPAREPDTREAGGRTTHSIPRDVAVDSAFSLHSNPGAPHTIFLDFDGIAISSSYGNSWMSGMGLAAGTYEGWDPKANGPAFNDDEKRMVIEVWQRVADDFYPFNVDVTTEAPAGSWSGSHAVISDSSTAHQVLCEAACGGIAYRGPGTFGTVTSSRPAWTLTKGNLTSAKSVAEATSHEVGHNLNLSHDATSTLGYYAGHGNWAPIMGVGYSKEVTQWSKGEYPDASNTEDDLAIIGAKTGYRTDEPNTIADAKLSQQVVVQGEGSIFSETDWDTYQLGTCSGNVGVRVENAPVGPNLDLRAYLVDANGNQIGSYSNTASMDATFSAAVTAGPHFLRVASDRTSDYSYYASIGSYTWSVTGCDAVAPPVVTTTTVTSTYDDASKTVTVTATVSGGAQGIVQFSVGGGFLGAPVVLTGGTAALTLPYESVLGQSVVAVYSPTGPQWTSSVSAPHSPVTAPGAVATATASFDPTTRRTTIEWTPPAANGGSALTGYRLRVDGTPVTTVGAGIASHTFDLAAGPHTLSVAAVNARGEGNQTSRSVTVGAQTSLALDATVLGRVVTLTATVAGDPIPEGTVQFSDGTTVVGTVPVVGGVATRVLARLPLGSRTYSAAFVPADERWSPSASTPVVVEITKVAPAMTVTTPRSAALGARPTVTVEVLAEGKPVTGEATVQIGRKVVTVEVVDGEAVVKLRKLRKSFFTPTQLKRKRAPLVVTFLGTDEVGRKVVRKVLRLKR